MKTHSAIPKEKILPQYSATMR